MSKSHVSYKKAAAQYNDSETTLAAIVDTKIFDLIFSTSSFKEEFWIGSVKESGVLEGMDQVILKALITTALNLG